MRIDALEFPILLIADDGWVEYVKDGAQIAKWTRSAVMKYENRRIIVLEAGDRAWRVVRITTDPPIKKLSRFLAYTIHNPKVPITIEVEPIVLSPIDAAREALDRAIEADDDVLTQQVSAEELRNAVRKAGSFQEVVTALKRAGAI